MYQELGVTLGSLFVDRLPNSLHEVNRLLVNETATYSSLRASASNGTNYTLCRWNILVVTELRR